MQTLASPGQLLNDQFRPKDPDTNGRKFSLGQLLALLPSVLVGGLIALWGPSLSGNVQVPYGALLTATSILTGMTFSQAVVLWNKSIDARRDPNFAFDPWILSVVDAQKALLIWTTLVGVVATGLLVLLVALPALQVKGIFGGIVAVCVYQLILVTQSLLRFFRLSYVMR